MSLRPGRRAFTIVELLVALSVIGVLLALLLPAVQRARESARQIACRSNLRQLCLALHSYASTHNVLPPGIVETSPYGPERFSRSFGWTVMVLPYIEQSSLYEKFDFSLDCQIHHRALTKQSVPLFSCPSDTSGGSPIEWNRPGGPHPVFGRYYEGGWGTINYLGNSGIGGMATRPPDWNCGSLTSGRALALMHGGIFFQNSRVRIGGITDGTSNTLMLGERGVSGEFGKWGGPGELVRCPGGMPDVTLPGVFGRISGGGVRSPARSVSDRLFWWSEHDGGTHFGMADGSVRFVSYSTDHTVLAALATRSDGEPVGEW